MGGAWLVYSLLQMPGWFLRGAWSWARLGDCAGAAGVYPSPWSAVCPGWNIGELYKYIGGWCFHAVQFSPGPFPFSRSSRRFTCFAGPCEVFSIARIALYIIYKFGIKRSVYRTIKDRYFTLLHKIYTWKAKNQEFSRINKSESLIIQWLSDYIQFMQLRYIQSFGII